MGETARILIVDDDADIRKVLTAIFENEGYIIESVDTAKEAMKKTRKEFFNLALIDIRLPDMEGIELLTKMRETTPKMRKIIITGYPTLQNAIKAVNRGADSYILKPFDMEQVLAVIKDQLNMQSGEKKYSQEKIAEFIETRVRELDAEKEMTWKRKS